ncbi:fumarylacetoacetase [Aureococcus anophagefferens]|nr:fumarylacetoacetase [Aureococcus anophagefferens]
MSFVASANGHDQFPIENLPLGIFSHAPSGRDARVGVAIGDSVLDLRAASAKGLLDGLGFAAERPNWLRMPIGYHGRASSVVPSGTPVTRPKGQLQVDTADASKGAAHGACRLLDFELEVAFFVGGPPNALGAPLDAAAASARIFGFVLCNDWSARDVQKFEYVPLGPFGAKNFATTISCWVVSPDALEPFRCATSAGVQDPPPLAYLDDPRYGSYDVALEVALKPAGAEAFAVVSTSNLRHLYWTPTQQLVHHSVTGCDMRPGDLLASGTISGSAPGAYGSMLELSWMGSRDVGPLADGSTRTFLQDGDAVKLAATCRASTGPTPAASGGP